MPKKRRVFIPPKRTPPGPPTGEVITRPAALSINTSALEGRPGLSVGDRVRILGTGLYAGEIAIIERVVGGVVPAASVRTEAGRSRTVRTIDLAPVGPAKDAPVSDAPAPAAPEPAAPAPDAPAPDAR